MEEITITLEKEDYEKLVQITEENGITIEELCNKFLELCVKENGLVIWEDGYDKPYRVLRTKEEYQEYIQGMEE